MNVSRARERNLNCLRRARRKNSKAAEERRLLQLSAGVEWARHEWLVSSMIWQMRSVVLASIVSLVLPPGWCCSTPQPAKISAAKLKCSACCATEGESASESRPATPAVPQSQCCCQRNAAVKQIDGWQPDQPEALFAISLDLPVAPGVANEPEVWLSARSAGPPLHLLHCVWRC